MIVFTHDHVVRSPDAAVRAHACLAVALCSMTDKVVGHATHGGTLIPAGHYEVCSDHSRVVCAAAYAEGHVLIRANLRR